MADRPTPRRDQGDKVRPVEPQYDERVSLGRDRMARATLEDLRHSELQTLDDRLRDLQTMLKWDVLFMAVAQLLVGAGLGVLLTDGWKLGVFLCFGFAVVCAVAYFALRDTQADSIEGIRRDLRRILGSYQAAQDQDAGKDQGATTSGQ